MSVPNESDFALIKVGDGATPTEAFATICGIESVNVNRTAQTQDKYRRDCAKPGQPAVRKLQTTGKALTISSSGGVDKPNIAAFDAALGIPKNYKIELYQYDGTDAGKLMGTFAGNFIMTAANMSLDANSASSGEMTFENNGAWTWTAAP